LRGLFPQSPKGDFVSWLPWFQPPGARTPPSCQGIAHFSIEALFSETAHAESVIPKKEYTLMNLALFYLLLLALLVALPAAADWSVADAGAVGDGATDCTAAFQKTLDDAGKTGGIVQVPAGRYRINGNLSIPSGVTLQGTFRVPAYSRGSIEQAPAGSVLLAYAGRGSEAGPPFIRLAGNSAVLAGVVIEYPEWKHTDVPPVPYPPCVYSEDTQNVGVIDCMLLNPYEGINLIRAHRHQVRNIHGHPIKRGIYVDECYDIGHIDNIHFWPFSWHYGIEDPYSLWINTKGVAFEFARTDWEYVTNTFCFGYGIGYKFSESAQGSANGSFIAIGADSCRKAVVVEQAQTPGLLITNGEFVGRWGSSDSICLDIGEKVEGKVSLSNCSFWGPIDRCVWMRSARGQVTLNGCNLLYWNCSGTGVPAIQLDAGRAILQGNTFANGNGHIVVGPKVISAIITANQSPGGVMVANQAGKRARIFGNEDPVGWTERAKLHYRVYVGTEGDNRYLKNWYNPESAGEGSGEWKTVRWSMKSSEIVLPVVPKKEYKLTLNICSVPPETLDSESGLYLGEKRIAKLPASGVSVITATLPPSPADKVTLTLRCKGWVPREHVPGSQDDRTLGALVFAITMRAKGAGAQMFNANTGEWR